MQDDFQGFFELERSSATTSGPQAAAQRAVARQGLTRAGLQIFEISDAGCQWYLMRSHWPATTAVALHEKALDQDKANVCL